MSNQEKLAGLQAGLDGAVTELELHLKAEIIKGGEDGDDVLLVTIQDREEFPVYITVDDSQILCISHLWKETEVKADKRTEMLEAMLTMNVPMPLSSFSKLGHQYLIFGALSNRVPVDEVIEEIETLSENTLTAVEEFAEFLN